MAQTYRSIFPAYVQVDEFGCDMALRQSALDIHRRLLPLVEKLADAATLADYDAYQNALEVYTYAKTAKAEAGQKGLLEQMGSLFKKSCRQRLLSGCCRTNRPAFVSYLPIKGRYLQDLAYPPR